MGVWVKYGLGFVGSAPFYQLSIRFFPLGGARGSQDIMRTKIKRSELINRDFTIEAKAVEANGLDFLTILV